MNEVLLIGGMALVTFAVRYPVLALVGKIPLPKPVFRALRFVPPAVLTAIVLPALLLSSQTRLDVRLINLNNVVTGLIALSPQNQLDLRLTNTHLVAGLIAVLIAWRTRNLLLTIILGMLALWVWQAILASHLLG